MKTEDFQFFWYPGVVQYVHKIYQTAADVPKKVKKHAASASVSLKVTNTPTKTEDFRVFCQKALFFLEKKRRRPPRIEAQDCCQKKYVFDAWKSMKS